MYVSEDSMWHVLYKFFWELNMALVNKTLNRLLEDLIKTYLKRKAYLRKDKNEAYG